MSSFVLSQSAYSDLKNIAIYTQKTWGEAQRKTYLKNLDAEFYKLSSNPELGKSCDYIQKNLKKYAYKSHVVFYQVQVDRVFIVRILHKRMDVATQFNS